VDLLTKQMGLDRPVLVRYVDYLAALASGDLGYSTRFKLPVKDVIFKHLANTRSWRRSRSRASCRCRPCSASWPACVRLRGSTASS